jgi:hypothetical protein
MALLLAGILNFVQNAYLPSAGLPFQLNEERTYIIRIFRPLQFAYQFFVAPIAPLAPSVLIREGAYTHFTFVFTGWSDTTLLRLSTALA